MCKLLLNSMVYNICKKKWIIPTLYKTNTVIMLINFTFILIKLFNNIRVDLSYYFILNFSNSVGNCDSFKCL